MKLHVSCKFYKGISIIHVVNMAFWNYTLAKV